MSSTGSTGSRSSPVVSASDAFRRGIRACMVCQCITNRKGQRERERERERDDNNLCSTIISNAYFIDHALFIALHSVVKPQMSISLLYDLLAQH